MRNKELIKILDKLVDINLIGIRLDNNEVSLNQIKTCRADSVWLGFDNDLAINISAVDIPHFYGEGDLDIMETKFKPCLIAGNLLINKVRMWGYKPKGFNIFPSRNFVQLEFIQDDKLSISVGFFEMGSEIKFLSTAEIALSNARVLNRNMDDRLIILWQSK